MRAWSRASRGGTSPLTRVVVVPHDRAQACGKARFDVEICLGASCNETACGSEAAVSQCEPVALKGACKGLVDAYVSACPDEKALVDACGTIFKTVAQTCGGGADGGLDAGK